MYKIFFIKLLLVVSTLHATLLQDKIENIIGKDSYTLHNNLIKLVFKDEKFYIKKEQINYDKVFKKLQENGLLNLRFVKPKEITIEFKSKIKKDNLSIKIFKILNDTMRSLGFRYFFTKSMTLDDEDNFIWKISFKAEYMIDPVELTNELLSNNSVVLDVEKRSDIYWVYDIDFNNSKIDYAIKIDKNEKVKFQKPLQAYFIEIEESKNLQIISRNLNNWFPSIVFFDKDLQITSVIKKNRVFKGLTVQIPKGTRYIKITDMYNLINIKRGLTFILR
ncbi:MAG: hypothetical protein U9R37_06250 [Campylobacterota bacterium]|nr:hypothetical protein [Campylobacterota bacterium]